jgi:hypothetical protein
MSRKGLTAQKWRLLRGYLQIHNRANPEFQLTIFEQGCLRFLSVKNVEWIDYVWIAEYFSKASSQTLISERSEAR